MTHPALLKCDQPLFFEGYTPLTRAGESSFDTGMNFGIFVQTSGKNLDDVDSDEVAWVLLDGAAEVEIGHQKHQIKRTSLFDENPTVIHLSPGSAVRFRPLTPRVEWARISTPNSNDFASRIYFPNDIQTENRGLGMAENTAYRKVRLAFDLGICEQSNLVVGEVVNLPGRWSSYPPHHHLQPEIYHYRFSLPQGYGHAEIGDDVVKIKSGDTIKIMGGKDHSQVSAPGYGMYYLWLIRHLPGAPYQGFEFTEAHRWLLDQSHAFQKHFTIVE